MGNGEWGWETEGRRDRGTAGTEGRRDGETEGQKDGEMDGRIIPIPAVPPSLRPSVSLSYSPLPSPHSPFFLSSSQAIFGHTKVRIAFFGQLNIKPTSRLGYEEQETRSGRRDCFRRVDNRGAAMGPIIFRRHERRPAIESRFRRGGSANLSRTLLRLPRPD